MREPRLTNQQNESSTAEVLAAEDDARLGRRVRARLALLAGIVLVAGSLMLWPQGLFGLGVSGPAVSLSLIASGAILLLLGAFVVAWSVRRLAELKNSYSSTGKPDAGFVFVPDVGLPQIGQGHGGPTDASAALFANPDRVFNGRK